MKIYELIKTVNENLQEYIGNQYKITKGHATGWGAGANLKFDSFIITPIGSLCNENYLIAFSPDVEVELISKKEIVNIDNKVFELADRIKESSEGIMKDYNKEYVSYDFTRGCIIANNILLDFVSEIWDVDLTDYYTPNDLPRSK